MRYFPILLLLASAASAQDRVEVEIVPSTPASRIIGAFEAGQRARMTREMHESKLKAREVDLEYRRQQLRLLEAQTKLLEQKLQDQETQAEAQQNIKAQVDLLLEKFTLRHADWKNYEALMVRISQTIPPKNLTDMEYMELLYLLAKTGESAPCTDRQRTSE